MVQDVASKCHQLFEQSLQRYNEQSTGGTIRGLPSGICIKPLIEDDRGHRSIPTYVFITYQGHLWWLDHDDHEEFIKWTNEVTNISGMSHEAAAQIREEFVQKWIFDVSSVVREQPVLLVKTNV